MGTTDESRLRGFLEIGTAILLGLVSVATAAGAYQASEWSQQAGAYAAAAGQLRDESLATSIAMQVASSDDGDRISEVLAIDLRIDEGTADIPALREEQQLILEGGSPGLVEEWNAFVESGYAMDLYPMTGDDFLAAQLSPIYGANRASGVAYGLSDDIGDRSLQIAVAAAIFALALLLLGVSGANRSLKVAFSLAAGGAGAFVVGVVVSLLAVIG